MEVGGRKVGGGSREMKGGRRNIGIGSKRKTAVGSEKRKAGRRWGRKKRNGDRKYENRWRN